MKKFTDLDTLDELEEEIVPVLPERCREPALELIESLRSLTEEETDELREVVREWLQEKNKQFRVIEYPEEMINSNKKGQA